MNAGRESCPLDDVAWSFGRRIPSRVIATLGRRRMKLKHGLLVTFMPLAAWPAVSAATATDPPIAHAAATCADYDNQAQAQRAKDTHDADGDGIYCESLPCPCLPPDPRAGGGGGDSCTKPHGVQRLVFSKTKYPHSAGTSAPLFGRGGRSG
jgi:hypothetical protein